MIKHVMEMDEAQPGSLFFEADLIDQEFKKKELEEMKAAIGTTLV